MRFGIVVSCSLLRAVAFLLTGAGAQAAAARVSLAQDGVDIAYIEAVSGESKAWYVNQYLRRAFVVRIMNVVSESACRRRKVLFVATQSAGVGKDALATPAQPVVGDWVTTPSGKECRASIRWRLGEVPGRQELQARLVRLDKDTLPTVVSERHPVVSWTASAHLPAALIAGFSYNFGPNPPPTEPADTMLTRRGQPFFGVEFVPVLEIAHWDWLARGLEHIRLTAGTSYREPGYDTYLGVSPMALLDGLRSSAFPVQMTIGHRWSGRGNDTWFVAVTANASALFAALIGKL